MRPRIGYIGCNRHDRSISVNHFFATSHPRLPIVTRQPGVERTPPVEALHPESARDSGRPFLHSVRQTARHLHSTGLAAGVKIGLWTRQHSRVNVPAQSAPCPGTRSTGEGALSSNTPDRSPTRLGNVTHRQCVSRSRCLLRRPSEPS